MAEIIHVKCKIKPGGFSGERVFVVTLADGTELKGVASRRFLLDRSGKPIGADDPPEGKTVSGLLLCRIIEKEAGAATVEVPNAELAYVAEKELVETSAP
jgi:hypothetical protein